MAKTIQKKVKFSKGQIVPELVERTDLNLLERSAQKMKNVVSTIYGGVKTRRGTKYIDYITNIDEREPVSITSDFTDDTSHFTDTENVSFETIGNSRVIGLFDYGSTNEGVCQLQLKSVKTIPLDLIIDEQQTTSVSLNSGEWGITISGASGGRRYGGETSGTNSAFFTSGGSGGGFDGVLRVPAGIYDVVVGSAGLGSGNGGTSSFSSLIIAEGGYGSSGGGNSDGWGAGSPVIGNGGSISVTGEIVSKNIQSNGNVGRAFIDNGSYTRTAPAVKSVLDSIGITNGGVPSFNYSSNNYHSGIDLYGTPGYLRIKQINSNIKIVISASEDGSLYEEESEFVIGSTEADVVAEFTKQYRYIKIEVKDETGEALSAGLSFMYARNDISSISDVGSYGVRLVDFVYNDTDRHLLCLTDNTLQIFKDDVLIKIIEQTGIRTEHIPELKWSSKDDTVVFTQKDLRTKILKRKEDGDWTFGDLDWKNVPYTLFGEETKTSKSIGITPSGLEGAIKITADSSVFNEDSVGQFIDGNGGRFHISEYISNTVVNGYTVIPFYTTDKFSSWDLISGYEPAWSEERGYPRTCCFAQQRLWFAGSAQKPSNIWASRIGDYFNFKNAGNYDNDAIDVEIVTNDPIVNLVENRGLHIFTTGQEMSASESSLTPDSFSVAVNTHNGSLSNVSPKILGDGILVFIEKNGLSLLSYVYDYNQASYTTDNLSMFSSLVEKPISLSTDKNSSLDKGDFLYLVLQNGTMLVNCLALKQDVNSCSVFETEGKVVDVCCLRDEIYLIVDRNNTICLEKMTENTVDCERVFSIVDGSIKGLSVYNNAYVYIKLDSGDIIKKRVENGIVNMLGIPDQPCAVGLAYEFELESNPIAVNGNTNSIKKRISKATVTCENTKEITFNGQKKKDEDVYTFYACTKYDNDVRFNIKGEYNPINILSVQLNINYEG